MQDISYKHAMRKQIRTEKQRFSQQELAEASLLVIHRLLSHPRLAAAKTVMMYWSLPDEVETHAAVNALTAMGKTVILPIVVDNEHLQLCKYTGLDCLKTGAYGIMEPQGEPFTATDTIDLIIVPGMAFDPQGHRLGRGKGYYDRFLATVPKVYKIGMCFDFQKKCHVPFDEHDIQVDEVL